MTRITVTTQAELDSALTNPDHACATHEIVIDTPAGVWIEVSDDHGQDVRAYGSSSVDAHGSATVRAYGSATVIAHGSSSVTASGSASVTAHGSASVTAHGSSSVTAHGSATVRAYGSASAIAFGSASVRAVGMVLGVPGWELMRRAAEAGRLESVDEIAAGLINDEGWDE